MNATHEVFNQPNALVGHNLFTGDHALQDALRFNASALATEELSRLGATLGTAEMQTHARLANVNTPQLHTHDRVGRRSERPSAPGCGLHHVHRARVVGAVPDLDDLCGGSGAAQ